MIYQLVHHVGQKVTGYDFTILSGEITFENGKHTGVLPGKLVKNPRHLKNELQGVCHCKMSQMNSKVIVKT